MHLKHWPLIPHKRLFDVLPQLYYVGGCVRNALLNMPIDDYDMACALPPTQVVELLQAAGIKTIPTGLLYGTVTAVLEGQAIEITSFRADVQTDGRYAQVEFGGTLQQDAQRRDLTMNGLYIDAAGTVIDPVVGTPDALEGHVRFIGNAAQRVQEDYLRILRFFRFYAWYGRGSPDADGIAACHDLKQGLQQLSRERITKEILKLCEAPHIAPTLQLMQHTGVWQMLFGCDLPSDIQYIPAGDVITRLAWLFDGQPLPSVLRLSNIQQKTYAHIQHARAHLHAVVRRALVAHSETAINGALPLLQRDIQVPVPLFPITGQDLQALGYTGAPLGHMLNTLKQHWAQSDFTLSKTALLAFASPDHATDTTTPQESCPLTEPPAPC